MFVARYEEWIATFQTETEGPLYFDGAKDLLKYLWRLPKEKRNTPSSRLYVTDYYDVELIPAKKAYFVLGSDVLGPMGKELIAHRTLEAAEEFKQDHSGEKILTFEEITPAVLEALDPRK